MRWLLGTAEPQSACQIQARVFNSDILTLQGHNEAIRWELEGPCEIGHDSAGLRGVYGWEGTPGFSAELSGKGTAGFFSQRFSEKGTPGIFWVYTLGLSTVGFAAEVVAVASPGYSRDVLQGSLQNYLRAGCAGFSACRMLYTLRDSLGGGPSEETR